MNYMAIPGTKWKGSFEEAQTISQLAKRQDSVIRAVCQHYGITLGEMQVRCRKRQIVVPRQVAMYLLNKMLGIGCADVARVFKLHHTTAIHNFKLVQDLIDTNEEFRNEIRGIKENIF